MEKLYAWKSKQATQVSSSIRQVGTKGWQCKDLMVVVRGKQMQLVVFCE